MDCDEFTDFEQAARALVAEGFKAGCCFSYCFWCKVDDIGEPSRDSDGERIEGLTNQHAEGCVYIKAIKLIETIDKIRAERGLPNPYAA